MDLFKSFNESIQLNNLFSARDRLLLAVSGGIDSVVLCELCYRAGYDFIIAHSNFQLRGEESERDEQFVKTLGKRYGREVLTKRFDTAAYASSKKVSIQVAARELRYEWFDQLIGRSKKDNKETPLADFIVTAHHADDNIETLLMNFFKGTGIAGLRGMLPKQGKIVRPLLNFHKHELRKFTDENNLSWVEDSSNESDDYSRNYIRHQVIPLIEKIYPGAVKNLTGNIERFRDIETLYHQSIDRHKKKLIEKKGNELHIPVLKLQKVASLATIIYEIIKEFQFSPSQVDEVIHLMKSESGKYIQSSTHRIIKNRQWLIIAPLNTAEADNILIEVGSSRVDLQACKLEYSIVSPK